MDVMCFIWHVYWYALAGMNIIMRQPFLQDMMNKTGLDPTNMYVIKFVLNMLGHVVIL